MQVNNTELKQAMELLCAERGITMEDVVEAIEVGIAKAYRKDFGALEKAYEAEYDIMTNTYKIFEIVTVVDDVNEEGEVHNPERELTVMQAKLSDPKAELGKIYKTEIDKDKLLSFGRVASGIAKQSFDQYIRNVRHAKVLKDYKEKIGELINVEIDYFKKNGYYVKLGTTSAFLDPDSLMPNDNFKPGEFIKVYVDNIIEDPKLGSRIVLKRNTPEFVVALIKKEIPEVASGDIEILKAVREAGLRTKILVQKEDPESEIDPVGTIIGRKQIRMVNLMRELNINMSERIDVIEQNDDLDIMIRDTLEPARINNIEHTSKNLIICYCDKSEAPLAVGKFGVNVRLASKLLGKELKIQVPEAEPQRKEDTEELSKEAVIVVIEE